MASIAGTVVLIGVVVADASAAYGEVLATVTACADRSVEATGAVGSTSVADKCRGVSVGTAGTDCVAVAIFTVIEGSGCLAAVPHPYLEL